MNNVISVRDEMTSTGQIGRLAQNVDARLDEIESRFEKSEIRLQRLMSATTGFCLKQKVKLDDLAEYLQGHPNAQVVGLDFSREFSRLCEKRFAGNIAR